MKKSALLLGFFIAVAWVSAQNKEMYQKEMGKIVSQLDSVKSPQELTDLDNRLIRVTKVFPNEWQLLYYRAYINLYQYFMEPKKGISALNESDEKLQKAVELENADKSEIWALQGYINMMKISADPMNLSQTLTTPTYEMLQKSIKENPANPRPRLVLANLSLGKKQFFKEDISSECNQLHDIEKLLNTEIKTSLSPSWGNSLLDWMKEMCVNSD